MEKKKTDKKKKRKTEEENRKEGKRNKDEGEEEMQRSEESEWNAFKWREGDDNIFDENMFFFNVSLHLPYEFHSLVSSVDNVEWENLKLSLISHWKHSPVATYEIRWVEDPKRFYVVKINGDFQMEFFLKLPSSFCHYRYFFLKGVTAAPFLSPVLNQSEAL